MSVIPQTKLIEVRRNIVQLYEILGAKKPGR